MTGENSEPVEISSRMRPGERAPDTLAGVVTPMGQAEDRSMHVLLSWLHRGLHIFANLNQNEVGKAPTARALPIMGSCGRASAADCP